MPNRNPSRRSFLRAGAALPACLTPAFGHDVPEDESVRAARAAWERARLVGQPLLVLVAPAHAPRRATAAGLWTRVLGECPAAGLLALGACEVHAASIAVTAAALDRELELDEADVLALLFETNTGDVRTLAADARLRLPSLGPGSPGPAPGPTAWSKRWSRVLAELVGSDWQGTQRRYGHAWSAPLPDDLDPVLREVVHARRAFVRQRAFEPLGSREHAAWTRLLVEQVRARLVQGGPSGARWTVEPTNEPAPGPPSPSGCAGGPCGTGHFPPRARRLLEFYTRS